MKIILIGADGQLGSDLARVFPPDWLIPLTELDITDSYATETVLGKYSPEIIINAAAYTDVTLLLAAIRAAGGDTSPDAIANALENLSIDTVMGHMSFTPERVAEHNYYIVEIVKRGDVYTKKTLYSLRARMEVVDGEPVFKVLD